MAGRSSLFLPEGIINSRPVNFLSNQDRKEFSIWNVNSSYRAKGHITDSSFFSWSESIGQQVLPAPINTEISSHTTSSFLYSF